MEQRRTQGPQEKSLPKPQVSASNPWLRLAGSAMWEPESQTRSCARVIPSVPEWAQIWAQIQFRENFEAGNCLKRMVGRDGIEPPTPGFSVLFPDRCKCA